MLYESEANIELTHVTSWNYVNAVSAPQAKAETHSHNGLSALHTSKLHWCPDFLLRGIWVCGNRSCQFKVPSQALRSHKFAWPQSQSEQTCCLTLEGQNLLSHPGRSELAVSPRKVRINKESHVTISVSCVWLYQPHMWLYQPHVCDQTSLKNC